MSKYYSDDTEEAQNSRRRNPLGIIVLLLSLVGGALYLQSTLAANISFNSGAPVEFGQGITATTACTGSSAITIVPQSSFENVSGGGSIKFSSLRVSGIPTSCQGAVFHFLAFENSAPNAISIYNTNVTDAAVFMKSDNTFISMAGASGISVTTISSSSFNVEFTSPVANSNSVYKITVESKSGNCEQGIGCAIGNVGPGGGIVFLTPASAGNSTGKYFEVSPANAVGTYRLCNIQTVNGLGLSLNIGNGETNTAILNANSNCNTSTNMAYAADQYSNNGYSDWFLPSRNELKAVKDNVRGILNNWSASYPSSSEASSNSVWWIDFDDSVSCGGSDWPACTTYKDSAGYDVRPVRSFSGLS
ncbi:MAG: hypothetical protein QNL78_01220 [Actinomycetes bacterium]